MAKIILMRVTGELVSAMIKAPLNPELFSELKETHAIFKPELDIRLSKPKAQ